jgi:hypothetical protein
MPSRVLSARLMPDCERPEERGPFQIPDLRKHVLEYRTEIVNAGLTILYAHHLAGRPLLELKPFGRFEEWSDKIRQPMVWAGFADPCETRESVIASNPDRDAALLVLGNWYQNKKGPVTLRDLIRIAIGYVNGNHDQVEGDDDLKAAFLEVASELKHPEQIDAHRLDWWCRRYQDRTVGEFKLLKIGKEPGHGFMTWQVAKVEKQESEKPPEPEKPKEPQGPEAF